MHLTLTRGDCAAVIDTLGGELISYRDGAGVEYIWGGDPAYWSGRNPVLFPIIGALRDGTVEIDGAAYEMPRHGVARRMEFTVVAQGCDAAQNSDLTAQDHAATQNSDLTAQDHDAAQDSDPTTQDHAAAQNSNPTAQDHDAAQNSDPTAPRDWVELALCDDAQSRLRYPFRFRLRVRQALIDGGFRTSFVVENRDDRPMPFCLGGHTAFRCPLLPDERFEDYIVKFDQIERVPSQVLTAQGYLLAGATMPCLEDSDRIALNHAVFDAADTLVLEGLRSTAAELVNPATGRGVRMDFAGFPMFALWTAPHKNAPYLCLEPWQGCDHVTDEDGSFSGKRHCVTLPPGGSAEYAYRVTTLPPQFRA